MDRVRTWLQALTGADRVAIGMGVLVVPLFALSNETDPEGIEPRTVDLPALGLLAAAVLLLLLRRRFPGPVVVAVVALASVWYLTGYTNGAINIPILVAFYQLGTTGDRRQQFGFGTLALAIPFVGVLVFSHLPLTHAFDAIGYPLAALLFGEIVRLRRQQLAEYAEKAAAAEAERDAEAERRVAEERLRIARDVHDVVAHAVAVMTVQAGVAADAQDRDPVAVREALATIRSAGKAAMADMQATVAVLRGSQRTEIGPAPRLDRLGELVDGARAQGLEVDLELEVGDQADLDRIESLVQLTAYRVVQESLTNVMRHAKASRASVRVAWRERSRLEVEVVDDGSRPRVTEPLWAVGFGLRGMRERVESLGGTLTYGWRPGDGWEVVACLPTRTGDRDAGAVKR